MKTCKDCLHYDVYELKKSHHYLGKPIGEIDEAEIGCRKFTDRSEWVHIPCKVGDTVYEVRNDTCACYSCIGYDVFSKCCEYKGVDCPLIAKLPVCSNQHLEIITYNADKDFILHRIADFGKTIFLTREEAERALEEMKDE